MKSQILFSPGYLNSLRLPNRIIQSATWDGLASRQGDASAPMIGRFEQLIKGGVGLSMTGFCAVDNSGKILPYMLGIESNERIPALARLTHRVHELGGIIGIQLSHGGIRSRPTLTCGEKIFAVSMPEGAYGNKSCRLMTSTDIIKTVQSFEVAAIRAKKAGFDLIQIQAGHGYLINQFLSPLWNKRNDEYGGSLDNRARFLYQICQCVRNAVGESFPLTVKINGSDITEGGVTLDDSIALVAELHTLGIDAVEVSGGQPDDIQNGPIRHIHPNGQEGYFVHFAEKIKKCVPAMQIIAVGGIRSAKMAQRVLSSGNADYVALCRPLIRDPNLPATWGQEIQHKSDCISCNKCFTPGLHGKGIQCVQRIQT